MRPEADRSHRHAKCCGLCQPEAAMPRSGVLPGEKSEDGAGMSRLVAVVEVVGAGIVEVDGLLHEPQPQRARVEVEVPGRVARNSRHVMNAAHGLVPFSVGFNLSRPNIALIAAYDNLGNRDNSVSELSTDAAASPFARE